MISHLHMSRTFHGQVATRDAQSSFRQRELDVLVRDVEEINLRGLCHLAPLTPMHSPQYANEGEYPEKSKNVGKQTDNSFITLAALPPRLFPIGTPVQTIREYHKQRPACRHQRLILVPMLYSTTPQEQQVELRTTMPSSSVACANVNTRDWITSLGTYDHVSIRESGSLH